MSTALRQILKENSRELPSIRKLRAGADGTRVNFFSSRSPDGGNVLIEIVRITVPRITIDTQLCQLLPAENWFFCVHYFRPGPQYFRDRPGLGDTSRAA